MKKYFLAFGVLLLSIITTPEVFGSCGVTISGISLNSACVAACQTQQACSGGVVMGFPPKCVCQGVPITCTPNDFTTPQCTPDQLACGTAPSKAYGQPKINCIITSEPPSVDCVPQPCPPTTTPQTPEPPTPTVSESTGSTSIPASGINLEKSKITITLSETNPEGPSGFVCFDEAPNTTFTKTFQDAGIVNKSGNPVYLDDFYSKIGSCFTTAGKYTVVLNLEDTAGNTTVSTAEFNVAPSDPDGQKSTVATTADCIADGTTPCSVEFKVKDQYGNPVTQITTGDISATNPNLSDEGFLDNSTHFFEGLTIPSTFESMTNATGAFQLTAIAPSIKKIGSLVELIKNSIPFTFSLPTINSDGTQNTSTKKDISTASELLISPAVVLKPNFGVDADGKPIETSKILAGTPAELSVSGKLLDGVTPTTIPAFSATITPVVPADKTNPLEVYVETDATAGSQSSVTIDSNISKKFKKAHEVGYEIRVDGAPLVDATVDTDTGTISFSTNPAENCPKKEIVTSTDADGNPTKETKCLDVLAGAKVSYAPTLSTSPLPLYFDTPTELQNIYTSILKEADALTDNSAKYGFLTTVTYQVGDKTVSYPAGGLGDVTAFGTTQDDIAEKTIVGYGEGNIQTGFIGADIEGDIQGDPSKMFLVKADTTGTQAGAISVGENTAKDVREKITENAFKLMRGATKVTGNSLNWGSPEKDVLVFEGPGTFTLNGATISGKKTLIVHNANLYIKNDITYASNDSSFGVIVINDKVAGGPTDTGNIFIDPSVSQLVGTYYADGTLATSEDGTSIANSEMGHDKQLVLTGSILTHNTIGGSIKSGDTSTLFTPWGETTDKAEAMKYDLHFVRRYPGDGGNCTKVAGICDQNINAFVIRIDHKASELPPPGFTF